MRILAVAGLFLASGVAASAQTPVTVSPHDYGAAAAPRAIASADFNRDGWLDLATAGTERDSIAILLNNGANGGFRTLPDRVVGGGPFDIAAGDLNRDGIPDLVIANADADAVDVLLGAGDGTFPVSTRISMPGAGPRGLALTDFDGNGRLDIIVTEFATGAWRVLYGNGLGGVVRQDRFGSIRSPQGVVAADFNHDGRPDVAIAGAGINLIAVFYTQPNGGIVQKNVVVGTAVNVLAAGDFNHDGWLDLSAASTAYSTIYTLHGSAAGLAYRVETPSGSSPRGLLAVDVNEDGWLDLVTANRASSTVNIHFGLQSEPGRFSGARTFAAGAGSRDVAAGDFDHDGAVDLAAVNEYGDSVTVLTNTTAFSVPAFRFALQQFGPDPSRLDTARLAVADLDRDGRLDVVSAATTGLSVRLGGRDAVTLDAESMNDVAIADLNGDGAPDLVVADYWNNRLLIYLNHGDGTFAPAAALAAPERVPTVETADFNGDGKADVVFEYFDQESEIGFLRVLLGRGNGTFVAAAGTDATITPSLGLAIGDFDRDGNLDVAGSGIAVWYGKGDGTPSRVVSDEFNQGFGRIAAADLNEDGRLDLITISAERLLVWLALPAGGFAYGAEYPATMNPNDSGVYDIGVGDLNLDGHVDVITNGADILYGDGTGALTVSAQSAFEWTGESPLVADYNGDGLPDMLFAQTVGFSVLLNRRGGVNRAPTADAGPDVTFAFVDFLNNNPSLTASGFDPDLHELRYEWRDGDGNLLSAEPTYFPRLSPLSGVHTLTVTVDDGRGGRASDSMVLTVTPYEEVVLHIDRFFPLHGSWRLEEDASAAFGVLMRHPDANAPKVTTPLAEPTNYVEYLVVADSTQVYKLWMRLRADRNYWGNDSLYVQFEGAVDAAGNPVYQIGTTSALAINLEECSGCGISGWGWEDDGWGAKDLTSTTRLRFPTSVARMRIQTREDGVAFDQITFSARKYLTTRPGTAKNDTTILPPSVR